MFVRDMDLTVNNLLDNRRPEVVADGLTLWNGSQLAMDTTLASPLHRDGRARRKAATHNGAALQCARRRNTTTYPELTGEGGRARLVVLAAEVGGRFSKETASCEVSRSATDVARPRQSSPLPALGRHPRVHGGKVFRSVAVGPSASVQHRNGSVLGARGVAGCPVRVKCGTDVHSHLVVFCVEILWMIFAGIRFKKKDSLVLSL